MPAGIDEAAAHEHRRGDLVDLRPARRSCRARRRRARGSASIGRSVRLTVTNAWSRASCATSANRSGWRGAMTSSGFGDARLDAPERLEHERLFVRASCCRPRRPAVPTSSGSTEARGSARAPRAQRATGPPSESNFRLPVTTTRDGSAPISMMRRADSSLCMQNLSTSASTRRKNGRASL